MLVLLVMNVICISCNYDGLIQLGLGIASKTIKQDDIFRWIINHEV